MIPVYVMSSEKYNILLPGFAYLWNTFASELAQVVIVADTIPEGLSLPSNFTIKSVTNGRPAPKSAWSDMLISAAQHCPAEHFVLLLSDYWLVRSVDDDAIPTLTEYAHIHPEILRVDLTDDRQFNGAAKSIGCWGQYDLVETPPDSAYQASTQAGIWSRDNLLSVLRPGLSPWRVELEMPLAERPDMRVVGTKQCPIRYSNVSAGGGEKQILSFEGIPEEHRTYLAEKGWLPK